MKTLKIWNGRDWAGRGGHLYIAAWSVADASRLYEEAWRIATDSPRKGLPIDALDVGRHTREIKTYFNPDCWGNAMIGLCSEDNPERGVWWAKSRPGGYADKPVRVI